MKLKYFDSLETSLIYMYEEEDVSYSLNSFIPHYNPSNYPTPNCLNIRLLASQQFPSQHTRLSNLIKTIFHISNAYVKLFSKNFHSSKKFQTFTKFQSASAC